MEKSTGLIRLKMKIHKRFEEDLDHMKSFVEGVFTQHKDLTQDVLMSMKSKMNKGIYSLNSTKELELVATIHNSAWHPHVMYVRLAYDFYRVNEIALTSMIDFLKKEFEKPLFFLIDQRFVGLEKLLLVNGFRFIRKTEVIHIHPGKCDLAETNQEIKSVAEIMYEPALMASLVELSKSSYAETHLANPVAELSFSSWQNAIMDDLIGKSSYVVVAGNRVTAFSFMYQGEDLCWELGWIGVERGSDLTLLDALLARQMQDAIDHSILQIEKEVDSTCPYSLHIAKSLSYDVSETFYAFIEE